MTSPGRPRITPDGVTIHPVSLTPETLATAKRLGDGNISRGVRSALAMACDAHAALALADYDGKDTTKLRAAVVTAERALRKKKG